MKILETDRLILRHLLPGDLDNLFALYSDPEIRRFFPEGTLTRDETREELEWFLNGHPEHPELGLWATVLKEGASDLAGGAPELAGEAPAVYEAGPPRPGGTPAVYEAGPPRPGGTPAVSEAGSAPSGLPRMPSGTAQPGPFVGRCGLLPWTIDGRYEVEVAYMIAREHWGRGLATEAAEGIVRHARQTLGLSRLICLIDAGNAGSIRVAEKVGMRFEKEVDDGKGPALMYSMRC